MDTNPEPAATPTPEAEGTPIAIESLTEDSFAGLSIEQIEEFLGYTHMLFARLKLRVEWAAKHLDIKQKARDRARRHGLEGMSEQDKADLMAHLAEEKAIKADTTLTDEQRAAKLAALYQRKSDKPPTQNLGGSFITRDPADVNPGNSAQA